MAMVLIDDATLQRIADAIKAKRGSDEKMLPSEMPAAITSITASGGNTETVNAADIISDMANKSYNLSDFTGKETEISTPVYSRQKMTSYANKNLKNITIDAAFNGCFDMHSFSAPNLESLNNKGGVLGNCPNLTYVDIGIVDVLPITTFYGCTKLPYVPNAEIITEIGNQVFAYNQAIKQLYLPKVKSIGAFAFANTAITYAALPAMVSVGGYIFSSSHQIDTVDIGDKCTFINNYIFNSSDAQINLIIRAAKPPTLNGLFNLGRNGKIKSIKVPAESVDLYKAANRWSNYADVITAITDDDVVQVPDLADTHDDVTIDDTRYQNKEIDAYINRRLQSINVENAFNGSSVKKIVVPNLQNVRWYAFRGCKNLVDVDLGDRQTIDLGMFTDCINLKSIPNNDIVTYIGESNFSRNPNMIDVILPKCTFIGWNAFSNCENLKTVILPAIQRINGSVFSNCHKLTSIDIGANAEIIDKTFIDGCKSTIDMIIRATNPPQLSGAFNLGTGGKIKSIKVPADAVDAYKTAANWSNYATIISAI